jgi:hypothetical protein
MKNYIFFLVTISICNSFFAQQLSLVPNQPDYNYYEAHKADETTYLLDYSSNDDSGFYTFNGTDINAIPFSDNLPDKRFMVSVNGKSYFVNGGIDTLYEYDGSQVNEIPFPESYFAVVYLGTINDKIYFATQVLPNSPRMISYDGNTLETYEIPEILFGGGNFYFAKSQNLIYFRLASGPNISSLWSFDGDQFTYFDGPPDMTLATLEHELNNEFIVSYYDFSSPSNEDYLTLFKCDGTTLTEIESPQNTYFYFTFGKTVDKMYVRFRDFDTGHGLLYTYDGNNLTPVSTSTDRVGYGYLGTFSGKDFLSFYRTDGSQISDLYSYDGNTLNLITGPTNLKPWDYAGSINNKLYIIYTNSDNTSKILYEFVAGSNEVTLVPNAPSDSELDIYVISHGNKLFFRYKTPEPNYLLYALDDSGFTQVEIPNYFFLNYDFTLGDKLYFSCYAEDPFTVKLFSMDANLNISENGEDFIISISVFPNPAKNYLNIRFNYTDGIDDTEILLFTVEGKLVDRKYYKQEVIGKDIQYSTDHLSNGIYILEVKNSLGAVQKIIIKQ